MVMTDSSDNVSLGWLGFSFLKVLSFISSSSSSLRNNDDVVNQVIIVFIGPQGCFKTSFTQNILPPELRAYFVIKSDFDRFNKDDLFTLTEKLIINQDEIDEIKSPQLNQIKSIVISPCRK
jgi:predicted P-loop ATPase